MSEYDLGFERSRDRGLWQVMPPSDSNWSAWTDQPGEVSGEVSGEPMSLTIGTRRLSQALAEHLVHGETYWQVHVSRTETMRVRNPAHPQAAYRRVGERRVDAAGRRRVATAMARRARRAGIPRWIRVPATTTTFVPRAQLVSTRPDPDNRPVVSTGSLFAHWRAW